ncbi:hypothetical protein [Arsenicibacter rosenii]|uniref:Ig-like domain-containing protein n=1 Tax=Arsenicibacter rosenii TaxID=1750698 RepID=A0A1S2VE42_9BACT|nr:hypothetical protein [Arsenicibacter rosenii]OIN56993.1 hypothetical protein BLX24_21805 [Arsenicibacter rosenii]
MAALCLLLAVCLLPLTTLMAQTTNWTGGSGNAWNNAGNWDNGVPTATLNAVISGTATVQPVLSTMAEAKYVEVKDGASLTITATGSLSLNGSTTYGLLNSGTVLSAGAISIGNSVAVTLSGILNGGTGSFTNAVGGSITINRAGGSGGLNNSGTFVNDGLITIGNIEFNNQNDIENYATFINSATGIIRMDRGTSNGLWNLSGSFTNDGKIFVGLIANTGTGILNYAPFRNNTGAEIHITRVPNAIVTTSGFVNSATITVGASASVSSSGVRLTSTGSFTNTGAGLIQIDNTGSTAILTAGVLANSAGIRIGSLGTVAGQGISNSGSFTNASGGNISINRTGTGVGGDGVFNGGSATFVNASALTIGDVAFVGQDDIYNAGSFTNTTTGIIRLDRALGNGLWNLPNSRFRNDGKLIIGSVTNMGVGMLCTGTLFMNSAGAEIHIDRVTRGMTNVEVFSNAGLMRIGAVVPPSELAILNVKTQSGHQALFTNQVCGIIEAFAPVSHQDGSFTNDGLLTVSSSQISQELPVSATIINNGTISYPQGNPIANVENNDLIIPQVTSCSAVYANALQIGGSNSFSIGTTWYRDAALTQPAGTYNPATNTFTANSLPAGVTILYASVTDNVNTCTRTVAVGVNQQQPGSASIQSLLAATSACPYRLEAVATGTSFVFTGPGVATPGVATPGRYVFSTIYRNPGTYSVEGLVVKEPGTYTLTVMSGNSCGVGTASQSVTISANRCP